MKRVVEARLIGLTSTLTARADEPLMSGAWRCLRSPTFASLPILQRPFATRTALTPIDNRRLLRERSLKAVTER